MIKWKRNHKWIEGFDANIGGINCNIHRFSKDRWSASVGSLAGKCFDNRYDAIAYCENKAEELKLIKVDIEFETASEYVVNKNKELYDRFSPHWTSPVGDTIKDLCEERKIDYNLFLQRLSAWTAGHYSAHEIDKMFNGDDELAPSVALCLSEYLGSTEAFWMKRSSKNLFKKPEPSKITDEKYLDCILIDFLIQVDKGATAKNCKIRFTKQELERFLDESQLHEL